MLFLYFRIIYLNLLMIIFFYFNMPLFIIFIIFIKNAYVVWYMSFEQINMSSISLNEEDEWGMHIDYDTDSTFYFQLWKGEYYLWFNCYFFFYFHGGTTILNELDFLDLILYKIFDLRNLKYSYKDSYYKVIYNKKAYYFLYEFNKLYLKRYNLKRNIKLLNTNTYNIFANYDNLLKFDDLKKIIYIKKFKNLKWKK